MKLVSRKTLLAVMLTAASAGAFATDSVDLKIIGTIAPTSCTPTLSGGGIVDFGNIPAASLSATNFTHLADKTTTLTVTCDAPARVAIRTIDNRAGTAVAGAVASSDSNAFGLGTVNSKQVGAYELVTVPGVAHGDGVSVARITSNNLSSWTTHNNMNWAYLVGNNTVALSWAPTGVTTPAAYTTITQDVIVRASLNKTGDLPDLTQAVPLDGLATFSLVYL